MGTPYTLYQVLNYKYHISKYHISSIRCQVYNIKYQISSTQVQRCKLCGKLGRSCPVGLGTSSRISNESPAFFVLSRNFAVSYSLFGYFWVNLPDFQHFLVDFGHIWTDIEHFLTAFISRFLVNGSDSQ